jgi:hypothetical protein
VQRYGLFFIYAIAANDKISYPLLNPLPIRGLTNEFFL